LYRSSACLSLSFKSSIWFCSTASREVLYCCCFDHLSFSASSWPLSLLYCCYLRLEKTFNVLKILCVNERVSRCICVRVIRICGVGEQCRESGQCINCWFLKSLDIKPCDFIWQLFARGVTLSYPPTTLRSSFCLISELRHVSTWDTYWKLSSLFIDNRKMASEGKFHHFYLYLFRAESSKIIALFLMMLNCKRLVCLERASSFLFAHLCHAYRLLYRRL